MPAVESALARKLGRFAPLAPDELAALAALEAERRPVAAGAELVREREAGQRAFILRDGWACCYKLLPDGGRQVIDVRLPGDFVGLRSVLPAHRRPLRRRGHRRRRRRGAGAPDARDLSRPAAARGGDPVGRLARRGGGGRAPGRPRPARRPDPHRALPGRARAAAGAGRPGQRGRLRLPAEPVPAGGRARAHRHPPEPRSAAAARAGPRDLPRRPGRVPRPSPAACPGGPPRRLPRPGRRPAGLRADVPLTNDDQIISWSYDSEPENNHVLVIAIFIAECERRAMLIWISAAPVSVGYTPTLLLTASPGRDGPRPRASIPKG